MSALTLLTKAQEYGVSLRLSEVGELIAFPGISTLPEEFIGELKSHKAAIIDLLHAANQQSTPVLDRSALTEAPLTHVQKRMWLLEQRSQVPHIIRAVFAISGALDSVRLENALSKVVAQNAILRVLVAEKPSGIYQVINEQLQGSDYFSCIHCSYDEVTAQIQTILSKPFQDNESLFQAYLLKLNNDNYRLVLKVHHLIADGVSMQKILAQLTLYYENSQEALLDCQVFTSANYLNFAAWDNSEEAGSYYKSSIDYWVKQLDGFAALDLPRMLMHKTVPHGGASVQVVVPQPIVLTVTKLSVKHGVTENVIYLAALYVLLSRYVAKDDLTIGIPVANRFLPEIQDSVGLFVNTLPLRVNVASLDTPDLLCEVQRQLLNAMNHSHAPFDKVFEQLSSHDKQKNIFEVIFNYFTGQDEAFSLGDSKVMALPSHTDKTNTPLNIAIKVNHGETKLNIDYDRYYFESYHIERLTNHLFSIIEGFFAQVPVNAISLLTPEECSEILIDWNSPKTVFKKEITLPQWFEEQVAKTPNNVALSFEEQELSYLELNEKANQLARHIRDIYQTKTGAALCRNTLVGICVDRSLDMVIGILAILKAGGAYVPMDIQHPPERLSAIIDDSGIEFVLSQESVIDQFSFLHSREGLNVLTLDGQAVLQVICNLSVSNLAVKYSPDDLAYVIYTSGSTGKPKGVMLSQHNVARLFLTTNDLFTFCPSDIWTLFHSYAFDMSVWEIFGALLTGGKLIVVSTEITKDFEAYHQLLLKQGVTVLNQTPGAFQQLITIDTQNKDKSLKSLRYITLAGDALNIESLRPWWEKYTDETPRIVNMYGITETTVHVTLGALKEDYLHKRRLGFIGQKLPDLQAYVLDRHRNVCPVGVPGELFVGGAGVAVGYLNRDKLTRERFILNPFAKSLGLPAEDRIYKSGDLVRWLEDGQLEYIGRTDFQVKIRGYRIELGEIENRLSNLSGISESCVIVNERNGQKYIAAYYIPDEGIKIDGGQLRASLLKTLPEYMVPKIFVQLERMPLTQNNKIDRKALPTPIFGADSAGGAAPKGRIEQSIAKVWERVLNITVVGRESNFFHLGGDSISLMQVIALLRQSGLQVAVRAFFEAPILKDLAKAVKVTQKKASPIKLSKVKGQQTISPIQNWFFEGNKNPNFSNQLFRLKTCEELDIKVLKQAIKYLTNYHDIFSLQFKNPDNAWVATYQENANYHFSSHDIAGLSSKEQQEQLATLGQQYHASLNIQEGRLAAFVHFKLGNSGDRLLIIMNHLIVDGVSWRILIEDLSELYTRLKAGLSPKVSLEKTTSYQAWSHAMQKNSIAVETRDFWQHFAGQSAQTLHTDFERGANNYASSARYRCVLDRKLTQTLLTQVLEHYEVKINALLLNALSSALKMIFGLDSVSIDMESHGRSLELDTIDLTRTVGWFTSIYPICLQSLETEHMADKLSHVQAALDAIPNAGDDFLTLKYGEDKLTELSTLQPEISFNYLGQFHNSIFNESIFHMAEEYYGEPVAPENLRRNKLSIVAVVVEGELRIDWNYSKNQYSEETVSKLADCYLSQIKLLASLREYENDKSHMRHSNTSANKSHAEILLQNKGY
jgi:amino acid adenylation domain-containing protein/non-ribosomal peptide synthase protein (TIGR01720 family)